MGNTNIVHCWLVQHHWLLGFFRGTSTVTDNHSSRWRQQTLCFMSLLKHLGESGICSASRKCPVPQKCPPGVHTWSKSSTFVTHAAVITIIFPSAPSKMGCLLRCSSYQLLFPPMGGCMPVKGEWWCCCWWGERTETEERCWKGQAFNEQENMWASPEIHSL